MHYAYVKPENLLNFKFGEKKFFSRLTFYSIMDYLVDIWRHDRYFKLQAIKLNQSLSVEFFIARDNKDIIKIYEPDGKTWIKKNYTGQEFS